MITVCFFLVSIVACLMTMFLKFHVHLVLHNLTTIENLEKMKLPDKNHLYDVGKEVNWESVFGKNPWLWAFPVQMGSGKPAGDGIYWPT
jgi:hypothetical protein